MSTFEPLTAQQRAKFDLIKEKVDEAGNTLFGAFFVKTSGKEAGQVRQMLCRRNSSIGVKGTGMPYDAEERGQIPVLDMAKYNGYIRDGLSQEEAANKSRRMLNTKTTFAIRVKGRVSHVADAPVGFEFPDNY